MNENDNTMSREKVMNKITKLMALATSPNEAEATASMNKAAELMEKYSITLGDCQTEDEIKISMTRLDLKGRTMRAVMWEAVLGGGIATCFDVETVRYMKRDGWHMAFMGTKPDVEMTIYFHKYLRRSVGRITDIENKGQGRANRNAFAHGMVNQILQRLRTMYHVRQEIKTSDSLALVTTKKVESTKLKNEQFPVIRKGKVRLTGDKSSWDRGAEAGSRLNIKNGLKRGATNGTLR